MTEKYKGEEKTKSCVTTGLPEELKNFKKICSKRCSICSSGILKELHEYVSNGMKFVDIVKRAKDELNVSVSTASLSRHFSSYKKYKTEMAVQILKDDTINEITAQSVHIKKTVELLDLAFDSIKAKMKAGTMKLDIADLEKLTKMRYSILNGENTDDKALAMIFQKASSDYGLDVQQGVMVFGNKAS